MKINKIFAAALSAALIFSACSKDNGANGPESQPISKASINVKFKLNGSKSRAIDPIENDVEQDYVSIKNAYIILIEGASQKAVACEYVDENLGTLSSAGVTFEDVSTAVTQVVVITNAGTSSVADDLMAGFEAGTADMSDLYKVIGDLNDREYDYLNKESIISYGEVTINNDDWTVNEDTTEPEETVYTSTANVSITDVNPILSRVDLIVNVEHADGWYAEGEEPADESYVVMKGAALLYSAAYNHFIPAFIPTPAELDEFAPGEKYLTSGLIPNDDPEWSEWSLTPRADASLYTYSGNVKDNFLHASWTGEWNAEDNLEGTLFSRSFYGYAPNDMYQGANASLKAKPTITVYGIRYIWDQEEGAFKTPEAIFWPIHFDGTTEYDGETLSMENGMRYVIKVNIKGDLTDTEKHHTGTPQETYLANVNVTVSEAEWKGVISVEQTFGEE